MVIGTVPARTVGPENQSMGAMASALDNLLRRPAAGWSLLWAPGLSRCETGQSPLLTSRLIRSSDLCSSQNRGHLPTGQQLMPNYQACLQKALTDCSK